MWRILLLIALYINEGTANDCVPYRVDNEIVACICNATYCDGPSDIPEVPKKGTAYWFMSNKEGHRMKVSHLKFGSCQESPHSQVLTIDNSKKYQTIIGFGGGFTDAAGINLKKLSPATQDQVIRAYYDRKKGSGYSLARIPIAGVDASTRAYSYDDVPNDVKLEHFSLTKEDYDYKIPYLKKALDLNPDTKYFSAAWTAPRWMKFTKDDYPNELTFLKCDHYKTYADYLIKFLDEYKRMGIDMWAISTGNEPLTPFFLDIPLTMMGWTPGSMADWVDNFFGPALAASSHNKTLILTLDDNRSTLPWFVRPILKSEKGNKYIGGIGVHWYQDYLSDPTVLDETHNEFPDKFILMTEASLPPIWNTSKEKSDSWQHGEQYILKMIEYLNHWTAGWVDWNIVLDASGGPNWQNVFLDAAIIVNPEKDEFYKQPQYYAMQHFSRFVDRGSIGTSITDTDTVKSSAFIKPSGSVAVILYNRNVTAQHVILKDLQKGTLCLDLPPLSMNTLIYS